MKKSKLCWGWKTYPVESSAAAPAGQVLSEEPLLIKAGLGALKVISVQIEGKNETDAAGLVLSHDLKNIILGGHP